MKTNRFIRIMTALALCTLALLTFGCGNTDHANIFHATFTAGGAAKDYTTRSTFYLLTPGGLYDATYTSPSGESNANCLYLALPSNVTVGVYDKSVITLIYTDATGTQYRSDNGDAAVTLKVTAWPGPGGYAGGSFSGILATSSGATIVITDGRFEEYISN